MKKIFKIKVNSSAEKGNVIEIPVGSEGAPIQINAIPKARYELIDGETELAPENIRISRLGKNLHISFVSAETTDLIIVDYYADTTRDDQNLIGQIRLGQMYAYVPELGDVKLLASQLSDGMSNVGMALGGDAVTGSGFAVGLLASTVRPIWLSAGAAGAAGAAAAAAKEDDVDKITPKISIRADLNQLNSDQFANISFELSEGTNDFVLADVIVEGGSLSNWARSDKNPLIYTALFMPNMNSMSVGRISVASGQFTDAAGNTNTDGAEVDNNLLIQVDTVRPHIKLNSNKTNLNAGNIATISFELSEESDNFVSADVRVDGGRLTNWSKNQSNTLVYTADFVPNENSTTPATISVASMQFADSAGNTNTDGAEADNSLIIELDTVRPQIKIDSNKTKLNAGSVATITFELSEESANFIPADVSIEGGVLTNWSKSNLNSLIYTADFVPNENSTWHAKIIVASDQFTDRVGNTNSDGTDDDNFVIMEVDTVRPKIKVESNKLALAAETEAVITFELSEESNNFVQTDVIVAGGKLSNWTHSETNSRVYTAVFVPEENSTVPGRIGVASSQFTDAAGNLNQDGLENDNQLEITIDTVIPTILSAQLYGPDDTGFSSTDGLTDVSTPRIFVKTDPGLIVYLVINGVKYSSLPALSGDYIIPITDHLGSGPHEYTVTAVSAVGNSSTREGDKFTIDLSKEFNYNNGVQKDDNTDAVVGFSLMAEDTGFSASDLITKMNKLVFEGRVQSFFDNGDNVHLSILDVNGVVSTEKYVHPVFDGGGWRWVWDNTSISLKDGVYKLLGGVVDGAGNQVGEIDELAEFTVDSDIESNYRADSIDGTRDLNLDASIGIDSIGMDTGYSASDFYTKDSSLTFYGSLTNFSNNGDLILLRLLSLDSNGLNSTLYSLYIQPVGHQWSWSSVDQNLPDGQYRLEVDLVDAAGNVLPVSATQIVEVDAVPNQLDGSQEISITGLSQSLFDLDLNDFKTNVRIPTFSGTVKNFDHDTQKVYLEVLDLNGAIVAFNSFDVEKSGSWSYVHQGPALGVDGDSVSYVVKTKVVDFAGNVLSQCDQLMVVDLQLGEINYSVIGKSSGNALIRTDSALDFVAEDAGVFVFNQVAIDVSAGQFVLPKNIFDPGQFRMGYRDLVGNDWAVIENIGFTWNIQDPILSLTHPSPADEAVDLVGSVGKYQFSAQESILDLSTLQVDVPSIGAKVATNHISMMDGGGNDTVKLSLGDVLALGVSSSFLSGVHKSHLQMRIDGDAGDQVMLDHRLGSLSSYAWSEPVNQQVDGEMYQLYSQTDWGVDLLIRQGLNVVML